MKLIAFLTLALALSGFSQSTSKNYCSITILPGHSAPNFSHNNHPWKGTFYPTGGLSLNFTHRFTSQIGLEYGLGVAGYALVNRGDQDRYTLDFAAPNIYGGVKLKSERSLKKFTPTISAHLGCQLGYQRTIEENYETYSVEIKGNPLIPFLRLKTGLQSKPIRIQRKTFTQLSFGTFARLNFINLGKATFSGDDYEVDLAPSGNSLGIYLEIAFALGNKKLPIDEKDRKSKQEAKGRF